MDTVAVVVATYGDAEEWAPFARRAALSAAENTIKPHQIAMLHGDGLSSARNQAAAAMHCDWLIFLDADDELDPYYVEEMLAGQGDIRQPSTLGVHPDGHEDDYPVLIPPGPNFMVRNHLVIGCMVRRDLFVEVGGFNDLPVLEDWDLFIRLRLNGASLGECPKAIYRVHVREGSRNQDSVTHGRVYTEIQNRYQSEWFAKGLA